MKIAHVIATFPPHIGGMGNVAFHECNELVQHGHQVTVFTLHYGSLENHDDALPFKVVRLKPFIRAGDAGWIPQLFNRLKNFDLVHLHYPFYGGAEWIWLAHKLYNQKYLVTYHMEAHPRGVVKRLIHFFYNLFLTKIILRGAKKILVVDKDYFFKNPHGGVVPFQNIIELPNAVNTNVFQPRAVTVNDCGWLEWENKKIVLFVGNLMPVKRLDLLLQTFSQLKDDVVLVVVGGGYEEAKYKKMVVDLELGSRVKFVGRCFDQIQLARYYNIATAVVVPSDAESFSLVVVEALSSGCPVVASDIPGIRSRIVDGRDGYLFQSGSSNDLKEKLEKVLLLSPEQRNAMGERGRAKMKAAYGIEEHIKKLEEIYQGIVTSKSDN